MDTNSKKLRFFFVLAILILIGAAGFYVYDKKFSRFKLAKPAYSQVFRLTNDKISQSAAIKINLPENISKEYARQNIKFNPEIEGTWLPGDNEREVVFKPKEKLKLNRYYSADLTAPDGILLAGDFLIAEDPRIIAIFPAENSETNEESEITIVFNRPMVPLTTLGYLEEKEVPVEIIPQTKGRFKWITTSNLQFIPEERLFRSSNYSVKIKPGLVSMDGLDIEGAENKFITRPLRYLGLASGPISYNQPISIYFNQAVDLEKTKKEISLKNITTNQEISFIAEYAKEKDGENQSIIQIYNQKDRYNRKKLWDFENSCSLKINRAYPAEGDIILDESRESSVGVTGIIANITAESERTNSAAADFFDPQGKLWVDFQEEIDLDGTKIISDKLKDIGYGEKCKETTEELSQNISCEKEKDKKRIYLIFQSEKIGLGEALKIEFKKIVNLHGLVLNQESIVREAISYPEFKIIKTWPVDKSAKANLNEFVFCTTSPISPSPKKEQKDYIKANLDYQINWWGSSQRVVWSGDTKCNFGEFITSIQYGLMPESNYSLEFNLVDVFDQRISYSLGFTTGPMPEYYLQFYNLQQNYSITTPQKTQLTFAAENMDYVNLDICKLGGPDLLSYLGNRPGRYLPPSAMGNCQKSVSATIKLPKRYWIRNYFKVDIKNYFEDSIGHYILTFSHPNYFDRWNKNQGQVFERSYLTVTNLAVAEKRIQPQYEDYGAKKDLEQEKLSREKLSHLQNLYWVTNLQNLEPIFGANVNLYQNVNLYPGGETEEVGGRKLKFAGSYTTNNQGIAFTRAFENLGGAVIEKDNDSAVIPAHESTLGYAGNAFLAKKIYLYTDKPIYRPSQEVFIKGIFRIGYDGNYEIYRAKPVNLKVFNSKNDEILNQNLEINDFGTFGAKLILEKKAPLGEYRTCIDYNCAYFDVQEYVPAAFQVEVKTDKEEYISGETANFNVEAKYYFGVPLEGGEVNYTISSQNYYFDKYSDGYFDFGSNWYYQPSYYGDRFLLRNKTVLSSDGKVSISQPIDFHKLFKNKEDRKSKIIVVDFTVKNQQGQSVSAQKSFIVHAGEFYLGINADKSFLAKDEEFDLKIKSVDTKGKEMKQGNIDLSVYGVKWIYSKRQEVDGAFYYNWEKKRELVEKYSFDTGDKGDYNQKLKLSKEGEYEVEVSSSDKKGNLVWSDYNIYVYGEGEVTIRPTNDDTLEIEAKKTQLNVGDLAEAIIKSPHRDAKALISLERGKIFEYKILDINQNLYDYNFKIKEEFYPNIYFSVLLLSSKPEIKFGKVEFQINTEKEKLDITVASNKKYYLPGEEVILNFEARDHLKRPVQAELSVAVVDLSVLALKGNPKKNPLVFFYSGFPLTVSTSSNVKNILYEIEVPSEGGEKGGSGGGGADDLTKKKRGIFKETAFWEAIIRTDKNGKAQVKFTLPDNLTTWQTEVVGLTQDTKLGTGYQEFTSKKELMVVPLRPRFVVSGDIFNIGAQIFNQSKKTQSLKITFGSQTLILKDDKKEKEVVISPDKTQTIYFNVQAPYQFEEGEHQFVLSAGNQELEDTVENTINITRNDTYEATATANYTTDNIAKEYVFLPEDIIKNKGNLSVKSSATLAVFLSDAIKYLLQFPYGCSEQIASKLNAIAIVKRGLNLPNLAEKFQLDKIKHDGSEYSIEEVVEIGLAEIYNNQQPDGGFSYWRGNNSSFHLTLHVVDVLNNLSLAGFKINQSSLDRAVDFLNKEIISREEFYEDKNTVILTAYTLSGLNESGAMDQALRGKIIEIANDKKFVNEEISNQSLAYLAILLTRGFGGSSKERILKILDNRIDIDARGAFLETGENLNWRYYETPVKNTALYLKALIANKSSNPIIDKVLRWLISSRAKDGAWGSTNNTITVIDSFTDFLEWKKETKSDFILKLLINDKEEGSFRFKKETILDQFSKETPLSNLKFGENNIVKFLKTNQNNLPNNFYYDMALKYYLPIDQIPPRDEGFSIVREFYKLDDEKNKNPQFEAGVGEVLREHIQITVPKPRNFVMVEDFIPAGFEIVNLELATEEKSLRLKGEKKSEPGNYYEEDYYCPDCNDKILRPNFKEIRDDRAFLFVENFNPGVYEFDYYVRALTKGKFHHLPAVVSEMYFPENFGRTSGGYFEIK